jgi:hypothetical protein
VDGIGVAENVSSGTFVKKARRRARVVTRTPADNDTG